MGISNAYAEYAQLDAEISALEAKKAQLRPHIISMMLEQGIDKIDIGVGKFSVSQLKRWKYPESVNELAEQLKAEKAKAESTGDATYEESPSLRYTVAKP